jgi:hypothetical protein
MVQQRSFATLRELDSTDRNRCHIRSGGLVTLLHQLETLVLTGANDQAGTKLAIRNDEIVFLQFA